VREEKWKDIQDSIFIFCRWAGGSEPNRRCRSPCAEENIAETTSLKPSPAIIPSPGLRPYFRKNSRHNFLGEHLVFDLRPGFFVLKRMMEGLTHGFERKNRERLKVEWVREEKWRDIQDSIFIFREWAGGSELNRRCRSPYAEENTAGKAL